MWVMRSKQIFVAAIMAASVACGAIASVAPSAAAEKNAKADIGNVTLTAKNVEALIASYPDVKKAANALAKKYKPDASGKTTIDAFSAWLAVSAAQGELNGLVTPYGFTDFRQWLDVLVATARAYAFAKDGGDVDAKMAAAIEQIKNNPDHSRRPEEAAAGRDQGRRRRGRHPEAVRGEHRGGDALYEEDQEGPQELGRALPGDHG